MTMDRGATYGFDRISPVTPQSGPPKQAATDSATPNPKPAPISTRPTGVIALLVVRRARTRTVSNVFRYRGKIHLGGIDKALTAPGDREQTSA
jgi:hypothetical protein